MKPVFADTSFFVCLGSSDDAFHRMAVNWLERSHDRIVTTDYVLVEVGNWFSKARRRQSFITLIDTLPSLPQVSVVAANRDLLDRGLDLYRQRLDKDWSLTDCTSFVVMDDQKITEAVTTDHHFEQAGFVIQLK